jgi:predicted DNA-binding transcriptional regulator AlpA
VNGVDAYDVSQIATGLASKVQRPLIALEVLPTADFDRREGLTPVPELIGADDAADLLGISRQAVLKRYNTGALPGHRVGDRVIAFTRRDVELAAAQRSKSAAE